MSSQAAKTVAPSKETFVAAGKRLAQGNLVAFPTETVYGLGAHALNPQAVLSIFQAKGRPLTDPVIVHVPTVDKAEPLFAISGRTLDLFRHLSSEFWPGPLTIVAKAAPAVPKVVTAETDFVGVRIPSHPIAREFLDTVALPVAAPSANRFGHISPTTAKHVYEDLGDKDVMIIDGGQSNIGIESTVLQIDPPTSMVDGIDLQGGKPVVILRRGGVSEAALATSLVKGQFSDMTLIALNRKADEDTKGLTGPGQLITHYAPDVDTFVVVNDSNDTQVSKTVTSTELKQTVFIDFAGEHKSLADAVLAYRDLSREGDCLHAAGALFDTLRWSETVEGAKCVLVPDLRARPDEHAAAVFDRIFRASSGRFAAIE